MCVCVCVLVEMWSEYQCVAANATDQLLFICSYLHALAPSVAMFTYLLNIHANVYCMHVASAKKKKKKTVFKVYSSKLFQESSCEPPCMSVTCGAFTWDEQRVFDALMLLDMMWRHQSIINVSGAERLFFSSHVIDTAQRCFFSSLPARVEGINTHLQHIQVKWKMLCGCMITCNLLLLLAVSVITSFNRNTTSLSHNLCNRCKLLAILPVLFLTCK